MYKRLQNQQSATVRTLCTLVMVFLFPGLGVVGGVGLLQPGGGHLVLGAPGSDSHVQAMPGSVQVLVVAPLTTLTLTADAGGSQPGSRDQPGPGIPGPYLLDGKVSAFVAAGFVVVVGDGRGEGGDDGRGRR